MLTIGKRFEEAGAVTLSLAGKFSGGCIGELRRAIDAARRKHQQVVIDLGEVTLIDRPCLQFLADQIRRDIKLVNCPEYIEPWICRESSG